MTQAQQPEALRWAALLRREAQQHGATDYKHKAADALESLHAENTTLQQDYDAARLEIESLNERIAMLVRQRDAAQAPPVAQGDALNNTVRVPLDSLHADAAYLIGRLQLDTMDGARVVEIIRERIEAAKAALAAQAQEAAPAAQGDALPREDFAWMVVQEACETEPADEDDPECIRILRIDLKSAVLAAFLRLDAARAQAKEGQSHE